MSTNESLVSATCVYTDVVYELCEFQTSTAFNYSIQCIKNVIPLHVFGI